MAKKLPFHIYTKQGEHIASLSNLEDAARLMGTGRIVRWGARGPVLWSEGFEDFSAGESFDKAARVMWDTLIASDVRLTVDEIRKGMSL